MVFGFEWSATLGSVDNTLFNFGDRRLAAARRRFRFRLGLMFRNDGLWCQRQGGVFNWTQRTLGRLLPAGFVKFIPYLMLLVVRQAYIIIVPGGLDLGQR